MSEGGIRARPARQRRETHRGCAATDDNAARRDAGLCEPAVNWETRPSLCCMTVRGIRIMLLVAIVIDIAYWTIWFTQRSWVESDTTAAYIAFENAFPLADAWLGLTCVLAFIALGRKTPSALLWLIAAGSAGMYLFGMDVLYDLQNDIYGKGAGGIIEAGINLITFVFSVIALRWAWTRRDALLTGTAT